MFKEKKSSEAELDRILVLTSDNDYVVFKTKLLMSRKVLHYENGNGLVIKSKKRYHGCKNTEERGDWKHIRQKELEVIFM